MSHVSAQEELPAATSAPLEGAAGVAGWLGSLLDEARDRGDAPLARLIANLMDDFRAAAVSEA